MRDELLRKGKIFLWGEIDEDNCGQAYEELCYCEMHDITPTLFICSGGGDVEAGVSLVDKIMEIGANTCVVGKAYSMGAIILAAGANRYAYSNSCVMFHSCSYYMDDNHENNVVYNQFCGMTYEALIRSVAVNCEMSSRQITAFLKKVKASVWMTAKQAQKQKIVTELL